MTTISTEEPVADIAAPSEQHVELVPAESVEIVEPEVPEGIDEVVAEEAQEEGLVESDSAQPIEATPEIETAPESPDLYSSLSHSDAEQASIDMDIAIQDNPEEMTEAVAEEAVAQPASTVLVEQQQASIGGDSVTGEPVELFADAEVAAGAEIGGAEPISSEVPDTAEAIPTAIIEPEQPGLAADTISSVELVVASVEDISQDKTLDKDQEREKILETTLLLFAERGFYQTSLVDIASKSGLGKASIYRHFQNKEAIADTLHADLTERIDNTIADIEANSDTSLGCLRSIIELMFELTEQMPAVARLIYCPLDAGLHQNKTVEEIYPSYQRMTAILKAGMRNGELEKANPKLAYNAFNGIISGAIRMYLDGQLGQSLQAHLAEVWYSTWRALGKNPNRPA